MAEFTGINPQTGELEFVRPEDGSGFTLTPDEALLLDFQQPGAAPQDDTSGPNLNVLGLGVDPGRLGVQPQEMAFAPQEDLALQEQFGVGPQEMAFAPQEDLALQEQLGVGPAPVPAPALTAPLAHQPIVSGDPAFDRAQNEALGIDEGALADAMRAWDPALKARDEADEALAAVREGLDDQEEVERVNREKAATRNREAAQAIGDVDAEIATQVEAEPDPGRWWSSRSGFQKAAGLFAAFAQGFLRPGEPNPVVDLMIGQIDRDVALQREQIAKQLQVLRDQKVSIGETLDLELEALRAEFASESAHFQGLIKTADIASAQADNAGKKASIEQSKAALVSVYAERRANAAARAAEISARREAREQQRRIAGAARRENARQFDETLEFKRDKLKADTDAKGTGAGGGFDRKVGSKFRGMVITTPEGTFKPSNTVPVQFRSEEDRKKGEELTNTANVVGDGLTRIKQLGAERVVTARESARSREIDQELKNIARVIVENGPRVSDIDIKIYKEAIGNPTAFWQVGSKKEREVLIDRTIDRVAQGARDRLGAIPTGQDGVDFGYVYEPAERIQRFAEDRRRADEAQEHSQETQELFESTGMTREEFGRKLDELDKQLGREATDEEARNLLFVLSIEKQQFAPLSDEVVGGGSMSFIPGGAMRAPGVSATAGAVGKGLRKGVQKGQKK